MLELSSREYPRPTNKESSSISAYIQYSDTQAAHIEASVSVSAQANLTSRLPCACLIQSASHAYVGFLLNSWTIVVVVRSQAKPFRCWLITVQIQSDLHLVDLHLVDLHLVDLLLNIFALHIYFERQSRRSLSSLLPLQTTASDTPPPLPLHRRVVLPSLPSPERDSRLSPLAAPPRPASPASSPR